MIAVSLRDELNCIRILCRVSSEKVRGKLINVGALTLDKTIEIALSYEYSQQQLKQMFIDAGKRVQVVSKGKNTNQSTNRHKTQRELVPRRHHIHCNNRRPNGFRRTSNYQIHVGMIQVANAIETTKFRQVSSLGRNL